MIKEATPSEVRSIVIFMKRFENETEFVKVDVDYTTNKYRGLVESGVATMFILEENGEMIGGLGCVVGEDLTRPRKIAVETYWLVDKDHRGGGIKLLIHFEKWAENKGYIPAMVHLTDSYPDKLHKLYIRRGYRLIENHYIKEV